LIPAGGATVSFCLSTTPLVFLAGALEGCRQQSTFLLRAAIVRGWPRTGGRRLPSELSALLTRHVPGTVALLAQAFDQIGQFAVVELPYGWMAGLLDELMLFCAQQSGFVSAAACHLNHHLSLGKGNPNVRERFREGSRLAVGLAGFLAVGRRIAPYGLT
jgi:hypothetical protein